MRRLVFAFVLCLGLTACEIHTSDNGDFDGMWQLTTVDSLATGRQTDMRSSGEYWAVQVHLLEVRNTKGSHNSYVFRFRLKGDSLKLCSPYIGEADELPELDVTELQPYFIDSVGQGFRVHTLNSDRMVLDKEEVRLSFRKY